MDSSKNSQEYIEFPTRIFLIRNKGSIIVIAVHEIFRNQGNKIVEYELRPGEEHEAYLLDLLPILGRAFGRHDGELSQ